MAPSASVAQLLGGRGHGAFPQKGDRARHEVAKVAAHVRATTSSIEDALRDVINSAQASGQLPDTRSARDLARYLIVTMQGLKVMGTINPDRASLMAVAETAVDALG
ncbi:hypothetical protein GCM10010250_66560 [Streptomyces althioticus]|nr:hypothetical protein GCM10010250_66560 [Streptomyces althioticus]